MMSKSKKIEEFYAVRGVGDNFYLRSGLKEDLDAKIQKRISDHPKDFSVQEYLGNYQKVRVIVEVID